MIEIYFLKFGSFDPEFCKEGARSIPRRISDNSIDVESLREAQ